MAHGAELHAGHTVLCRMIAFDGGSARASGTIRHPVPLKLPGALSQSTAARSRFVGSHEGA